MGVGVVWRVGREVVWGSKGKKREREEEIGVKGVCVGGARCTYM